MSIKEKRENRIMFNSYALDKHGRPLEEIGDDKLIKSELETVENTCILQANFTVYNHEELQRRENTAQNK